MSGEGVVVTTPAAVVTPAGGTWFSGYDADTQGHIAARGWDKLPVDQAVAQAVKAHREAERLIGVPAESLFKWPKDPNDAEGWAKIRERMGVPKEAKDYDFAGVKHADGTDAKPEFVESVRALAAKYHLPKDEAKALANDLISQQDASTKSSSTDYTTKLAAEKDLLAKNWGSNENTNKIIAQNAAQKVFAQAGKTPEQINEAMAALEKAVGYATVMEMFRNIGVRIGEDRFVNREGGPGGTGALTKGEAQAKLDALAKDEAWQMKYEKGDAEAAAQFDNLTRIVAGFSR